MLPLIIISSGKQIAERVLVDATTVEKDWTPREMELIIHEAQKTGELKPNLTLFNIVEAYS
jgi:hypothetical protein